MLKNKKSKMLSVVKGKRRKWFHSENQKVENGIPLKNKTQKN
tara:strand:- start:278 stop:403 length:126 start_codon:yes stop_codon:yes gene_type:complete